LFEKPVATLTSAYLVLDFGHLVGFLTLCAFHFAERSAFLKHWLHKLLSFQAEATQPYVAYAGRISVSSHPRLFSFGKWVRAKADNNWSAFAPVLDEWVGLRKEMAK
jgi:hypothetical protein